MDFFDALPIKRGRPKKIEGLKKKRLLTVLDYETFKRLKHLSSYQNAYMKYHYTPRLQNFIWNFIGSFGLPEDALAANLLEILQENVKFFMITEIEFLAFFRLMELVDIHSINMGIEEIIKICCLIVKKRMESDSGLVDILQMKVKNLYKKFEERLQMFENCLDFDIKDLNKNFLDFQNCKSRNVIYTYYVDQILRNSPPYCTKKSLKLRHRTKSSKRIKLANKVLKLGTTQQSNIKFTKLKPIRQQEKNLNIFNPEDRLMSSDFIDDSDFCSGYYSKSDFDKLI